MFKPISNKGKIFSYNFSRCFDQRREVILSCVIGKENKFLIKVKPTNIINEKEKKHSRTPEPGVTLANLHFIEYLINNLNPKEAIL